MNKERNRFNTWKLTRGEPIKVDDVTVQPFGAGTYGNLESGEGTVRDQFTVRGKGVWPGGVHSIIVYQGKEYDQVGVAKEHIIGQFTKHYQVRMSARGAEVK